MSVSPEASKFLDGLSLNDLVELKNEIEARLRIADGNPIRVRSIPQGQTFTTMRVVRHAGSLGLRQAHDLVVSTPFDLHLTGQWLGRPVSRTEILAELKELGVDCE